jgi:putative hydroxymethylpyrimidine transport system permease protein
MRRGLVTAVGLILLWEATTRLLGLPLWILPPPSAVAVALWVRADVLGHHALITATEIALGLVAGVGLGVGTALLVVRSPLARRWLMPVVIASQAIPVFALAPLLVLWFGYGLASKVVMAAIVIYFQ